MTQKSREELVEEYVYDQAEEYALGMCDLEHARAHYLDGFDAATARLQVENAELRSILEEVSLEVTDSINGLVRGFDTTDTLRIVTKNVREILAKYPRVKA